MWRQTVSFASLPLRELVEPAQPDFFSSKKGVEPAYPDIFFQKFGLSRLNLLVFFRQRIAPKLSPTPQSACLAPFLRAINTQFFLRAINTQFARNLRKNIGVSSPRYFFSSPPFFSLFSPSFFLVSSKAQPEKIGEKRFFSWYLSVWILADRLLCAPGVLLEQRLWALWKQQKRKVALECPCLFPLTRGTEWGSGVGWADGL